VEEALQLQLAVEEETLQLQQAVDVQAFAVLALMMMQATVEVLLFLFVQLQQAVLALVHLMNCVQTPVGSTSDCVWQLEGQ